MDPHPPFDHHQCRRAHPGNHYPDQHRHHHADQHLAGGIGGGAAPARARYDYESHPIQYPPSDHLPRIHHQPPPPPPLPPPPPHHRHDDPHYHALPLRATPETYSPSPYHGLSPHHHYHPHRHRGEEMGRVPCRHHQHHHHKPEHHHHHHHHHQPQLPREAAEKERRDYASLQHRLSPSDSRKRHRRALYDSRDHESTSSAGPPPRRQRLHQHSSYASDEDFVDRTASHPSYSRREGYVVHSDSKGNRRMQASTSAMLPVSPHEIDAGYPRRAQQKSTPARVSVWQRIEENPSVYTPYSSRQLPGEVHISPSKKKNAAYASKELASVISLDCKENSPSKTKGAGYSSKDLASVISLDCKAISPSKTKGAGYASKELASGISLDHKANSVDCKNCVNNGRIKKSTGTKSEKVLASVLVKPSPESKKKEMAIKQATKKPDKVQNNVPGFCNGSTGLTTRMGVKKAKKIVIKKIVRNIGARDKQTSMTVTPEQKDVGDANANSCEKEEGEITTSSFENDDSLISTSDTAGVTSSVIAEKEQNDCLMNQCKSNASAAIESVSILDTTSACGSQHPEKEDGEICTNPGDINATSTVDSTEVLNIIGSKHPGDGGCKDLGGQNSAHLCENHGSHMEEDSMVISGAIKVVVACNSPRMPDTMNPHGYDVLKSTSGNNAACANGVKGDTKQFWESMNGRGENCNVLLGSYGEGDLFTNNSFRSRSTDEASVTVSKDVHREKGSEMCVVSLSDNIELPMIAEPSMTEDIHNEEGNMLTSSRDKGILSVSSLGTFYGLELSVKENIQDKDGRIPVEPSKANANITPHLNARDGLETNVIEDIHDKERISPIELRGAATSVTHNEKAPYTMKFGMNENIQMKERQMTIDSNALETTQHIEAPYRAEAFTNRVVGSDVGRSHKDSDETHVDALNNSIDAPYFVLAGATGVSCTQELLHDQRIALDKSNLHREAVDMDLNFPLAKNLENWIMPLDGDTIEDSAGPLILNNDVGKDIISLAAKSMRIHRAGLSPANNSPLLPSRDSPSGSDNSEHPVPTTLTLGNNTYFSSAESEQPEENHKLIESNKGSDDVTATESGMIKKGKSESGDDWIKAGAQNWLTLPLPVNNVSDDATVNMDKIDLEQDLDEGTSLGHDHGSMSNMDQYGIINAFNGRDCSLKLSCSQVSQSDLLNLKERNKNIENESGINLPDSSVCSVNGSYQHGYQIIDKLIDNPNEQIILSLQSAGVTGGELASSQVVGPGHTYHSNTIDPVVESITKPDVLSSSMEATVSEGTKEHQPRKSTPGTFFGLEDGARKTLPDTLVNSALISSPRMNTASSTVPKVPSKPVALPGSSSEARLKPSARHMTWHRDSVSSCKSGLHASQPSGLPLPPKLPQKKNGKTQNSYIRKGNALIRNPATGNHPQSSSGLDASSKSRKPITRRSMNFVRKVDTKDTVAHSNISVERPKTPPLPLHIKSITTNISEQLSQPLQELHVDSSGPVNLGVDKPGISCMKKSEALDAGKAVYVRPKSNQLVASQGQQSGDSITSTNKALLLQPSTAPDLYFKKRKNQIILGSSTSNVSSSKETSQTENSNTGETKVLMFASSNKNLTVANDRPNKAHQTTNTVGSFSHVWTLSGQHPQRKPFVGTNHVEAFPRILPWKRKVFNPNYRSNYSALLNTSSLGIVRKLLKTKKLGTFYASTSGFSLRKYGLSSFDGSSLKWLRSLEKGSQKVAEEATLAVAENDRKKRERRKFLRNKGGHGQYSPPVAARNNNHSASDSRVPPTCNEYVRINKGNQLVRNPKKVIRMLASEKVRWSLHTVRSRLAKKQQYCQFFTRFGECKKSGGKCPYIHDRAKVAICTKFLKGLCSNASCKLTHKVTPERMPDCSYFLQGLCSNTTCPYRHVKVNINAPVCEDFLKGYCAAGDECRKKHSYVCPVFEATGECPQQSRCKLHHPKKKIKSKRSRVDTFQNNSWGRYFDSSIGEGSEAMRVCLQEDKQEPEYVTGGDLADFIDLGPDIDGYVDVNASDDIRLIELDLRNLKMQADNVDALIKPLRIMRTARV